MALVIFLVLIILFVFFRWQTKIAMGVAFAALLISAITYSTGSHILANQISVYAYGALAAAAIIGLANSLDIRSIHLVKIHVNIPTIFKAKFKILFGLATVALFTGAITYSIGQHGLANIISIIAYIALALGTIIMLIYNLRSNPEENERQ